MKKIVFSLICLLSLCTKVYAGQIYKYQLGDKLTLEQALELTTGFAIVQDGRIICKNADGLRAIPLSDMKDSYSWQFKLELKEEAEADYYMHLYNSDETSAGYVNASVWSHTYLSNTNTGEKTDGALWTIASTGEGTYSIRNVGVVEGNYDNCINENGVQSNKGYLKAITTGYWTNHACWQNEDVSNWEFYTLNSTLEANIVYTFSPVSLEEAISTSKPVVLMNEECKVLNGPWGTWNDALYMYGQSEFDAKYYQLKVEEVATGYTIKLNENGSYNRYLQASQWGHSFLSSTYGDNKGNDGVDCAIWTITSMGENKYSIRSLGVTEGNVRSANADGYLCVDGANQVKISSTTAVAWQFCTIDDVKTVYVADGDKPAGYLKDYTTQLSLIGTASDVAISDESYNDDDELISATFSTSAQTKNIFQYKGNNKLTATDLANATKIDIAASGTFTQADWKFSPAAWPFACEFTEGIKSYTVTATDKENGIEDFTIFSTWEDLSAASVSIHIDGITMYNSGRVFYTLSNVPANAFRTVCLENAAECLGATAYEIAGKTSTSIQLAKVKKMEAGKAYLVQKNTTAGDIEFVYLNGTAKAASPVANNGLVGTFTDNGNVPQDAYILSGNKLYKVNSTIPFTANHAYIDMTAITNKSAGTKSIIINDATAIISTTSTSAQPSEIYSINGARMNSAQRGINIVKMSDGTVRKYIVK